MQVITHGSTRQRIGTTRWGVAAACGVLLAACASAPPPAKSAAPAAQSPAPASADKATQAPVPPSVSKAHSQDAEASALFDRAQELLSHGDPRTGGSFANAREAIALYRQAIDRDPRFALAYVQIARA